MAIDILSEQLDPLRDLGADKICMGLDATRGWSGTFSDYPEEWRQRYIGEGMVNHDPVVLRASTMNKPATWDELTSGFQTGNVIDRARDYGLTNGVATPVWKDGILSIVSMVLTDRVTISKPFMDRFQTAADSVVSNLLDGAARTLTGAQLQVLRLISYGLTVQEAADTLRKSPSTVREQIDGAIRALGARNAANAVLRASRSGLI